MGFDDEVTIFGGGRAPSWGLPYGSRERGWVVLLGLRKTRHDLHDLRIVR